MSKQRYTPEFKDEAAIKNGPAIIDSSEVDQVKLRNTAYLISTIGSLKAICFD